MNTNHLKKAIKSAARLVGHDVIRFHPESSDDAKLACVLKHLDIDLVLDVGANEGQYGKILRGIGYAGPLVSFEPLSSAHAVLSRVAAADNAWTVHERCAVGDRDGEVEIHIAGNNVSSSVLPMLETHAKAAPQSRYIGAEVVSLRRLDGLATAFVERAKNTYLKIDTQGFEAQVLAGAEQVLRNTRAVQLELSLVPLYEGQRMWDWFLAELQSQGFVLWTLLPGFVDPVTARTLQMDAIFARTP